MIKVMLLERVYRIFRKKYDSKQAFYLTEMWRLREEERLRIKAEKKALHKS